MYCRFTKHDNIEIILKILHGYETNLDSEQDAIQRKIESDIYL